MFSLALIAAGLVLQAQAHTYLITPPSRLSVLKNIGTSTEDGTGNSAGLCHLGNGGETCCTSQTMGSQMKTYKRGEEIPTAWWRNNHVGGFVRYSIVPIDKSDSQDAFDAPEAMLSYECNQVTCTATYGGSQPNNWNGGDAQGSKGWSNACGGAFKIPYHMPDGDYTVQWVWFGQGNGNQANSPFQACIDLKISGGPTGEQPKCPLFKGGDMSEAGENVCTFVSVDSGNKYQGVCKDANACSGKYLAGVPSGLQQCIDGEAPKSFALGMVASDGAPDTFSNYSASDSPSKGSSKASSKEVTSSKSTLASGSSKKKCSNKKRRSVTVNTVHKRRPHFGKRSDIRKAGLAARKAAKVAL